MNTKKTASDANSALIQAVSGVDSTEVPATEVPATEVPATEVPATEVPATEVPATEVPATEVPATEVPATEVPATEVPATEPKFDWEKESGGLAKSPKEMIAKFNSLQAKADKSPFANEQMEQLNAIVAKGQKITPDLVSSVITKWSEITIDNTDSARMVIANKMRIDNPDLTSEEIAYSLDRKYGFNEEDRRAELMTRYEDDTEKVDAQIVKEKSYHEKDMILDAKNYKKDLKEYQDKLFEVEDLEDFDAQIAEAVKGVEGAVAQSVDATKSISIELGGETIAVDVSMEEKTQAAEMVVNIIKDPVAFWNSAKGAPGLFQTFLKGIASDKAIEEVSKRMSSDAYKKLVEKMGNQVSFKAAPPGQQHVKTDDEAIATVMQGRV